MSAQDWAMRKALQIWDECEEYWGLIGDKSLPEGNKQEMREIISKALKQEREIATLEMEAKWKKIVWPDSDTIEDNAQMWCEEDNFVKAEGFEAGVNWLKQWVEEKRR